MQDYKEVIQELEEKGYREYPPTPFDKYADKCWQKRFDDENGKKYFVDAKMYPGWVHPYTKKEVPPAFEYEIYLTGVKNQCPIEMKFYAGWTLAEVEEHAEKMFATGEYEYYERWEDC